MERKTNNKKRGSHQSVITLDAAELRKVNGGVHSLDKASPKLSLYEKYPWLADHGLTQ